MYRDCSRRKNAGCMNSPPVSAKRSYVATYPYSDTSRTYAPNTRIYEHIKGCFPRRWRPPNRDSTRAFLGNALKCRCRDTGPSASCMTGLRALLEVNLRLATIAYLSNGCNGLQTGVPLPVLLSSTVTSLSVCAVVQA